jgi:hypothetical protein
LWIDQELRYLDGAGISMVATHPALVRFCIFSNAIGQSARLMLKLSFFLQFKLCVL